MMLALDLRAKSVEPLMTSRNLYIVRNRYSTGRRSLFRMRHIGKIWTNRTYFAIYGNEYNLLSYFINESGKRSQDWDNRTSFSLLWMD